MADVRLVFDNAMTFNPKDHWVYTMALSLVVSSSFGSLSASLSASLPRSLLFISKLTSRMRLFHDYRNVYSPDFF